jgi:putative hydrolase of the HAD superfamily
VIRAVLFDAVGTLIQLREPVGETYARVAHAHGLAVHSAALTNAFSRALRTMPPMVFAGLDGDALRAAEREWWHAVVARVFAAAGGPSSGEQFERCFAALFAHFATADAWRATEGAAAVLAAIRARGLRTGMVSNFDYRLSRILDALGLAPLLEVVVLPADAGAAKPDARIFAVALEHLGVSAADALYVGDDAEQDIAGARAAGLQAIDVASMTNLSELVQRIGDVLIV